MSDREGLSDQVSDLPRSILSRLFFTTENLYYRVSYRNVPSQKQAIHDFIEQEECVVVVLDSCRYDYFEQTVGDFLSGSLQKVSTRVTATIEYVQTIWDDTYDMTYVTGMPAPTNHAFERKGLSYRPEAHFSEFVHVWQSCSEKELGAVPPEAMTDAALQCDADRMVVHYVQPHAPYIGEYRLRDTGDDTSWEDNLQDIYQKIGRYGEDEKVISDAKLRRAYESNLKRVLASVRTLVERLDRPVVVTADHGELLGEDGRYIHGGSRHQLLCEVPWYEVDESIRGTAAGADRDTVDYGDEHISERDVEEQLQNLGYK